MQKLASLLEWCTTNQIKQWLKYGHSQNVKFCDCTNGASKIFKKIIDKNKMMQTVDHPSKLKAVRNEMNMCGTSSALDIFKKRLMRCDDTLTTSVLIHAQQRWGKTPRKAIWGSGVSSQTRSGVFRPHNEHTRKGTETLIPNSQPSAHYLKLK